ncbi:hypothetical protein CLV49_1164 [Labedella gwakjiensis]|uniref:Secreted protein n=1 Tax=Labedella gwakjiensis TaxID=390269 RepID=A0A2P8GUA7_9MICO|nr:hypothetical protein [Labedella gwakjiensis]PSL37557.1 hypothetical protein CLV49_1164 [Labedella gwakjiensis]RUQ84857.1 hypothetical protein ELQ93_14855 [Labedella gwakjiensis]
MPIQWRLSRGIAAIAASALLTAVPAGAAHATPTPAASAQAASDAGCLDGSAQLRDDYRQANGLDDQSTVYVACTEGTPTVWAPDSAGQPVGPHSVEPADGSGDAAARDVEGFACTITDVWEVECQWGTTYRKYTGDTLVWERHISAYALMNLQQTSHKVYMRFTNDSGVSMDTSGNVILQRQQGITPPTFENSTDFDFGPGTQTSGTEWVDRTTTDEGKYSVIFNLEWVYDNAENMAIPIVGDPTSPRFQCYASSAQTNCEYPNGQEAGVF